MTAFTANLLYLLASALGQLPWAVSNRIGDAAAVLWRRLDARESRVSRRNLELAYPTLSDDERARLHRQVLRTTARQALETMRFWTRPHTDNLALIGETHGIELFDAACASGNGLIVAAPHYGNWELLNQWLAAHTALSILYRPPESAIGEAFLQRVRADSSGQVTQIPAEGAAVRQLLRLLQRGGVTGILPDQQPKAGDGVFVPFFGVQAQTMSLLPRLAHRTGATVLFAYCERLPATNASPAFTLHFESAPEQLDAADPKTGARALNAAVESIARRDPTQYQWTYKRYSRRPPDSGETNPYRNPELQ